MSTNMDRHNTGDVNDLLMTSLRDPKQASLYLEIALEEYQHDGDIDAFLLALKNVAKANGGLGKLALNTQLSRQNLYKTLSSHGNPRLLTLTKIMKALGLKLSVKQL